MISGGPILLGRVLRNRSQLNATLREKAERLRRERADQAEQAAIEERTRIAGELHDVVAHAMSAMVVQAGGARRLAEKDPERAREAFAAVEETGREALTDIRRLLGVLRREDEEIALAPQPSLRHLDSLVRRTHAAGLPVTLEIEGEERPLPPGVDLTAYRLVQSALGGALDHGAAGRPRSPSATGPTALDLEVSTTATATRPLDRRARAGQPLRRPTARRSAARAAAIACAPGCRWEARREPPVAPAAPHQPDRSRPDLRRGDVHRRRDRGAHRRRGRGVESSR